MRAEQLELGQLLEYGPTGGIIRFAGQRAILLDTVALGLLRKELVETLGMTAARGLLTRFGYAQGWRTAETLRTELPWESERDWKIAGGRLHGLQGVVVFEPIAEGDQPGRPFAEAIWRDSYEAEQHLLQLGQADEPVCWTLTGYASGYLSYVNGRQICCIEERCRGRGDAVCKMVGRPHEELVARPELAEVLAAFDRQASLDPAFQRMTEALRRTERQLRARRDQLVRGRSSANEVEIGGMVARSPAMRRVLETARRVAAVDSTVLLYGESGAGKEGVARLIHSESPRAAHPFVAINCAAVPESLLESELFGHARGAFTGATADRPGLFEAAHGGTLFLDEIGDVPAPMQAKLLRVLQEHEVRRVGENRTRPVDVRVVAATNRDLGEDVARGRFRQDLYYRLRVIELRVPPLRERREDLLPLARVLLAEAAQRIGKKGPFTFTPRAAQQLARHRWPGNVRELGNALERAVVLAAGNRIDLDDLPEEVRSATAPRRGGGRSLAEVEREHILAVLAEVGGNKARAAAVLGIGPATLFRKLKEYRTRG